TISGNSSAGSVGIMKTLVEKKSSGAYAACRYSFKDQMDKVELRWPLVDLATTGSGRQRHNADGKLSLKKT
ncbi:MAG: hypothetical protein M3X11_18675, partial [Acidobacteriota bacterium]|nr:hypothetical protein [Acidobacteriota bacterium]